MSGSISFGGLVSGLDTNALVDKLVAAEKAPITGYQQHQSDDHAKLSVLGGLVSSVQALAAAAQDLSTSALVNPLSATVSDSTIVAASATSGATSGSYALSVDHLARAQVNSSTTFASDAAPGDGSISITIGNNPATVVNYKANDTLETIAASVNATSAGVVASVLYDGTNYRLMLTAGKTGIANGMTLADGGVGLGFSANGSEVVTPLDAQFTINNVLVTRPSNHVTDALPGVTLDLKAPTAVGAAPTSIVVGTDEAALETKVKTLVTAYNTVETALTQQLAYTGTKKASNTLFGDSGLQKLQRTISGILTAGYGNAQWSAAQLGVSLAKDGTLSFDSGKFASTLGSNPTAAQDLFTGNGVPGLAQALNTQLDTFTRPIDGILVAEQTALTNDVSFYDTAIVKTTNAANSLDARLRSQFLAMEKALSLLQVQGGLLGSLGAGAAASASTPGKVSA